MRKFMLLLVAAGVAFAPLHAREAAQADTATPALTAGQRMIYEGWGADQQSAYDSWPAEAKAYFWTLSPPRQQLFFRLSDSDKIALVGMSPNDREAAWAKVESRVSPGAPGSESNPPEAPGTSDDMPPNN